MFRDMSYIRKFNLILIPEDEPVFIEGLGHRWGLKTTVLLQVVGAGHYLPEYAGNLDIMTSAARATGEKLSTLKIGDQHGKEA